MCELTVKLVIKCTLYEHLESVFGHSLSAVPKFPLKKAMQNNENLEVGDKLKPRVISDGLNEGCSDSAVRIGTFYHIDRCVSQRNTIETFKNALGTFSMKRLTVRLIAY
jgi:hypothetical protein